MIGLSVAEPYSYSRLAETAFLPDAAAYDKGMQEQAQSNVRKVSEAADKAGVPCQTLTALAFDPADEIVKTVADHRCGVIFIASHGRCVMNRLLLGSVTQKVLARERAGAGLPLSDFQSACSTGFNR